MEGFQPKVLKPSSVGSPAMVIPMVNHEKIVVTKYRGAVPQTRGRGGNSFSGTLEIKDCDGGSQATITWVNGLIVSSGNMEVTAGCEPSGSPGGS